MRSASAAGGGYRQGAQKPSWTKPREIYGADDAADWDLCTTFAKWGKCQKEGCTWRHEGGVWWEGAWWRDDGYGWDGEAAPVKKEKQPARQASWWRSLPASEECPVSLTPIRDLEDEPFELTAGAPDAASKTAPRHRFDANALAMFLVSSGQFMNPVNRRPLTLVECRALDKHLGKSSLRVADAFLLAGGGTARTVPMREAASMAHHLFHFPSVRDAGADGDDAAAVDSRRKTGSDGREARRQALPQRDAHVVHADGGLRVVDDNESESDGAGEATEEFPALTTATTASASRPKRAARPPRVEQATSGGTGVSCGAGVGARADASCGTGVNTSSSKSRLATSQDEDESESAGAQDSAASGSAEVWVPPWATVELQRSQLEEVEQLLTTGALTAEESGLAALRAAVESNSLLTDGPGIHCEVECDSAADRLVAVINVPTLYPSIPPNVKLHMRGSCAETETPHLVAGLQRALREEVIQETEDAHMLQAIVHWLQFVAPEKVSILQAERSMANKKQEAAAAAAPQELQKKEKMDVRKAEKFSPNWDLCSSFVKTGKCKNKSCKWRHEKPVANAPTAAGSVTTETGAPESKKVPAARKKR